MKTEHATPRNAKKIKLKIDKYKNQKRRLEHHYFEEETISCQEYRHDQNIYDNIISDLYDIIKGEL